MSRDTFLATARRVIGVEARALTELGEGLGDGFAEAVEEPKKDGKGDEKPLTAMRRAPENAMRPSGRGRA